MSGDRPSPIPRAFAARRIKVSVEPPPCPLCFSARISFHGSCFASSCKNINPRGLAEPSLARLEAAATKTKSPKVTHPLPVFVQVFIMRGLAPVDGWRMKAPLQKRIS
jgi:hypothetical protein